MSLSTRDRKIIWHPFTQEKTALPPIAISKASGSYLIGENGERWLDLISSWWVTLHGHAHPVIAKAIYDQACKLEQVIFAGFTHEPAVMLCEKLHRLLPSSLARYFYADNGSTAVETALKMAYQYWWNQGVSERTVFLAMDGGYHGDTFGAMSVGSSSGFHDPFSQLFFPVLNIPFPDTFRGDENIVFKESRALEVLENYLRSHKDRIAALILEPLVQGAKGMRMCRPEFIAKVVNLVRAQDILVIFDEVMTGFWRTGSCFALEQTGVHPDLLCLSKGLTGGFLPMALTVTTEKIYSAFLAEHFSKSFAHGHSYTANPLGCAAALASLDLLQLPETRHAIQSIQLAHQTGLDFLADSSGFQHLRQQGTIAAFDLTEGGDPVQLKNNLLKQGLLVRPLGKTVYLLPPYSTTAKELQSVYQKLQIAIELANP